MEKDVFEILIGISGIGPKTAISVLDVLSPLELADAVLREDDSVFKSVSGIGPKTAKIVLLQLRGRLPYLNTESMDFGDQLEPLRAGGANSTTALGADIILALCNMGVDKKRANKTVKELLAKDHDLSAKELLKEALKAIGSSGNNFGGNRL